MTPGPTRVPERVLRAGARPMIHHRTPEMARELAELEELLPPLFGTREPVLPVHATGRGGMEAAICTLFSPGDELIACCNGKFGDLWARLAEAYGLLVHRIATDWDHDVEPAEVERMLDDHPAVRGVAMTYGDTSTGVANDVADVARATRGRDVLLLVDGVSSIGGMPFQFDDWGVDAAITASQKCLMSSPGIAFAVLSGRARSAAAAARLPRQYWDLMAVHEAVTKARPETPGTTPVHLVLQVVEALRMLHEEGPARVVERHSAMAAMARERAASLGLKAQCPDLQRRSTTVSAFALPREVPLQLVREGMRARGILVAAGLDRFQSRAFRIGHMGDIRPADLDRTMAELAHVLHEVRGRSGPHNA